MADGFDRISRLAAAGTPFLFIVSYDKKEVVVKEADDLGGIRFEMADIGARETKSTKPKTGLRKFPVSFDEYKKAFDRVIEEIRAGNTYLLNLTFATPIATALSPEEIFRFARAPYKIRWPGRFLCFSPEPFIRISADGVIYTYPMKGTIDASIPDAKSKILADEKEMAEHVMVVDLLRNDLGIVGREVRVGKFRYIQSLRTHEKSLLQVSSEISARLGENWRQRLGEILDAVLPAGSVTGTPKKRTCKIIESVESHDRGFFTGVFGFFDGRSLQSAVMIRFIEETPHRLIYKSGGGITIESDPWAEYQEMIDKVYLPIF